MHDASPHRGVAEGIQHGDGDGAVGGVGLWLEAGGDGVLPWSESEHTPSMLAAMCEAAAVLGCAGKRLSSFV